MKSLIRVDSSRRNITGITFSSDFFTKVTILFLIGTLGALYDIIKLSARASEPAADYPRSSCHNRLLGVATMLRLPRHGRSVALESGLALAS